MLLDKVHGNNVPLSFELGKFNFLQVPEAILSGKIKQMSALKLM